MKILVIHNNYREPGGETAVYHAETALLRQQGHSVLTYGRENAEIDAYSLPQKAAFLAKTVYNWQTYRQLSALARAERPDVAHVHNVFPLISPAVYRALHAAGIPIVQTIHNFRFLCPNGLFYTRGQVCERCKQGNTWHAVRFKCYRENRVLSALYALSIGLHRRWGTFELITRAIALTEFGAAKLVESGLFQRDRISILGNFIPDPLPQPLFEKPASAYVAYLGRLSPEKGLEVLFEAVQDLPELPVRIAGGGAALPYYQHIVTERRLAHVEFVGYVQGETKWRFLRQAKYVVIPSQCYEMFPMTALESLAVGTPVAASRMGSLPHIVEDGQSGLLFPPGSPAGLRQALQALWNHPNAEAMGRHGHNTLLEAYTASAHYQALMQIYLLARS